MVAFRFTSTFRAFGYAFDLLHKWAKPTSTHKSNNPISLKLFFFKWSNSPNSTQDNVPNTHNGYKNAYIATPMILHLKLNKYQKLCFSSIAGTWFGIRCIKRIHQTQSSFYIIEWILVNTNEVVSLKRSYNIHGWHLSLTMAKRSLNSRSMPSWACFLDITYPSQLQARIFLITVDYFYIMR